MKELLKNRKFRDKCLKQRKRKSDLELARKAYVHKMFMDYFYEQIEEQRMRQNGHVSKADNGASEKV